ncbi:sec-independent protein translocase protein TatC [Streptosporangium becharense]|uniref:Sec-independent protein translocase protein TatC n=1 Tax=Streptosporangium becharense TaxID=1816182 RepID=A0A7W9ICQ8_9ACTN|nr:twin-arginine translocase subunit TatC [Streptosporangium becharense]MBB2913728.1 sec-independent protein translocase protein TatC [Streptosporangium becharense]MBB5817809.1 sec-independent protein translocase protein TatC [Streptosporangium becharense]
MALLKWPKPGRNGAAPPADSSDGRMPLMEHLRELRNRLVIALLGLLVGIIVGFVFFKPLWEFVSAPYCGLPQAQQLRPGQCTMLILGVFDSFFVNLKVAAMFGLIVSSPVWLGQIWGFVTPGLYRNEKRYSILFLCMAVPLFLAGAALAYFVMDTGLSILLGFAPPDTVTGLTIDEYLSYALIMVIVFGISFELPLLMVFLNIIGVLPQATVAKHRRLVIFLMFVFGAVATPGGDPFTMIALALPMVVLFALAEGFMYLREKRQRKKSGDFSHLSDDEASSLDDDPEPLDDVAPVGDPAPIDSKTTGPDSSG